MMMMITVVVRIMMILLEKNQVDRFVWKRVSRLESITVQNVIIIGRVGGEKCNNLAPVCFFISLLPVLAANFSS